MGFGGDAWMAKGLSTPAVDCSTADLRISRFKICVRTIAGRVEKLEGYFLPKN